MNTDLDPLTDAQLSEVFAVEVAGWRRGVYQSNSGWWKPWRPGAEEFVDDLIPFATSADAVLPWLPRGVIATVSCQAVISRGEFGWRVTVPFGPPPSSLVQGSADTMPRAACIALIKAKRAEKEASK